MYITYKNMDASGIEKIRRSSRMFVRELGFFHKRICGGDLTLAQGHILLEIDEMEAPTQDLLAKKLNIDQSTASRNLKNLVEKGLIRTRADKRDKKRKFLFLTKKGISRLEEFNEAARADTRAAFAFLSVEEQQKAIEGMELYANAWRAVNLKKFPARRDNHKLPSLKDLTLREVSPNEREVRDLITRLNEHNLLYYPPERCHLDSPSTLAKSGNHMIGAYIGDQICGIGAVKFQGNYGEIKRMFVPEEFRGNGISKLILKELLKLSKDRGYRLVRLETGKKFKAAVNLYKKSGFQPCPAFGPYKKAPVNFYMEKTLLT